MGRGDDFGTAGFGHAFDQLAIIGLGVMLLKGVLGGPSSSSTSRADLRDELDLNLIQPGDTRLGYPAHVAPNLIPMIKKRMKSLTSELDPATRSLEKLQLLNLRIEALLSELSALTREYWVLTVDPAARSPRRVAEHLKFLARIYREEMKELDPRDLRPSPLKERADGELLEYVTPFNFRYALRGNQGGLLSRMAPDLLLSGLESSIEFWLSAQRSPGYFFPEALVTRAQAYQTMSRYLGSKRFDDRFTPRMREGAPFFMHSECERALSQTR